MRPAAAAPEASTEPERAIAGARIAPRARDALHGRPDALADGLREAFEVDGRIIVVTPAVRADLRAIGKMLESGRGAAR